MNTLSNSAYQELSEEELFLISHYKQCPVHPKRKLTCISIDPTSKNYLKCLDCITLSADKNFLPLLSVLDSDSKTIFKNWPVIDDSEFYNELIDISQKKSFAEETKQQIKQFFKQFRAQIDKILEDKQDEMMKRTDSLWDINEKVLNQYNQLSAKDELKDILLNKKECFEKQNKIIGETVSRILNNQEGNKKVILDSLSHLKKQINTVDFEYANQIKESIKQQVKQIDIFLIKNLEDKDKANRTLNLKDTLNQLQLTEMTTSQLIIKLMNNHLNNCSDELLDQLNTVISTVEPFLNKTQITGLNNELILELDKLSSKQQLNLKQLATSYLQNTLNAKADQNNQKILTKLISNKFNQCSESFLQKLSNQLDQYSFIIEDLDFTDITIQGKESITAENLTDKQLNELISLVSELESTNLKKKNEPQNNNSQQNQVNLINKFNQLIQNKSNYCSLNFLEHCKSTSSKYPEIITQIYLQNPQILRNNETNPISFDILDDKQLKNIQVLVEKISQLSLQYGNDYKSNQTPQQNRQPNSFKINGCLSQSKDLISKKEFSQLLNDYPICELTNLQFSKNTVLNIEFIKANYLNSSQLKMERNEEDNLRIIQLYSLNGQMVTKHWLNVNANYIFRCKFNKKLNIQGFINIGIMKTSKVHSDYLYNDKCCFQTNTNGYGLDNVVKGKHLHLVSNEIDRLEVRVNISKRILSFADYPNFKNINSTNVDRIDSIGEYSFGIYFGAPGDNIEVEIECLETKYTDAFKNFS